MKLCGCEDRVKVILVALFGLVCCTISFATLSPYGDADLLTLGAVRVALVYILLNLAACACLVWGVFKGNHFYFLPWLFLWLIDTVCYTFGFIKYVYMMFQGYVSPYIVLTAPVVVGALLWYLWIEIYKIYKKVQQPCYMAVETRKTDDEKIVDEKKAEATEMTAC